MLFAMLLLAAVPAAGHAKTTATGRVVDPEGHPIAGAQVCNVRDGKVQDCVQAGVDGGYRIETPKGQRVFVRASGFVGAEAEAGPRSTPLVLGRAATLVVHVVDAATSQPLASGKVLIYTPSGRTFGDPVPFNRAGLRVSTLEPGDVLVRAEAAGFDPGGPLPISLVAGKEQTLTIPMRKAAKNAP